MPKAICGSLTLLQLWSWERLHVGRPNIAMHPLTQDMPLGHRWNVPRVEINNHRHVLRLYRSELDHQEDYQMWHRRTDYIIPPDEKTVDIGRVEYMSWYWSITRRYIGRPCFTYDMRYEPRDHIERSLVEGMKYLHMMATDGLQDDMISDSTQSTFIAMQVYIDSVLSQVQRTYSSTSDARPSEPCASTPQQPDDAGPPQFSPYVMTVSQYGAS
ncbi:hypothetical protein Taro_007572 [Colocasia esculenta]|uniref:Aminotransferase-like plant mobile domain-containing protein n=1 Tax=Colocasia esculenta TaxID=4460 RepID=A0A843TYH8_COLES|nr:hypothetical protein [Colocasia esculenta]